MSNEKVQSQLPPAEALECSYENYLAELMASAEKDVCIEKPEHHYTDQSCEPEIVANSDYMDTEAGIVEIIRVDEEKALERQAQRFQETEETHPTPEQKSEESWEAQPHRLPHSHGEEVVMALPSAPVNQTAPEEVLVPAAVAAGPQLCFCTFGDYPALETPRGMRWTQARETRNCSEVEMERPSLPESVIPMLGAAILHQDIRVTEFIQEIQESHFEAVAGDFSLLNYAVRHQITTEIIERRAGAVAWCEGAAPSDASKLIVSERIIAQRIAHSSHQFVSQEVLAADPNVSLARQGGIFVFATVEEFRQGATWVFVPYPGPLTGSQNGTKGGGQPVANGVKVYHRVNHKSGSQGSGERHPGGHSGGRQHDRQQHRSSY